jgi:hypothetical protein
MDAFRVGIGEPIFVLTRAVDKFLQLNPGEVVRATVVEVSPGGDVSLRIKGNLIQAKSTLQIPQDANVLFRVLGQQMGESGPEIRLQFLEVLENQGEAGGFQNTADNVVQTLTQELAASLPVEGHIPKAFATTVEQLLKSLPEDAAVLPKELREQLQNLLQASLGSAGQSIQDRWSTLLNEAMRKGFSELVDLGSLKEQMFTDIDKVLQASLKSVLENTGVGLEAKLRVLLQVLPAEGERVLNETAPAPVLSQSPETAHLQTDLKARLLQMKQVLLDQEKRLTSNSLPFQTAPSKEVAEKKEVLARMLPTIDGLLQDIETFQLLSKLTNSFYTFLPVIWKGLKEADIAFKKSRSGPEGKSYYCLMNLDFDKLGKMTVVAMMQSRDFFVSFKTDNTVFRSLLNDNVHELQKMFQEQGLNLKVVNFLGMQENHLMPFERLESFEHIINIKI